MLSAIDYLKLGELNKGFYGILTLFAHHLENIYRNILHYLFK